MRSAPWKNIIALLLILCMAAPLAGCVTGSDDAAKGIVISEVVSSNGSSYEHEYYGSPDWIELHNESDHPINLFGWGITDNVKNADKALTLPEIILPADGYLLLLATKMEKTDTLAWDGKSPICLGFSLKAAGEDLVLINANLQSVAELAVPALNRDISYARRENGTYGYCEAPTPGAANTTKITNVQPEPKTPEEPKPMTGVEISEVSPRNTIQSCGGCLKCDWVELHNTTNKDISLDGFTLCDKPSDYDDANLSGVLPANGYLLVYCCEKDCETAGQHVCVDFGISRYGETLYLFDPNGFELETLAVPEMPYKDVTYARRADGTFGYCETPTPGEANAADITSDPPYRPEETPQPDDKDQNSDEPVDPTLNATRPTGLRISEALANNAYSITDSEGERSDWVELFNSTDTEIPLSGWYLSDNPKNLMKWALPENMTLSGGQYLIVFLSGKTDIAGELHASFSLGTGETLFLYHAETGELDWVTIPELPDNVSVGLDENNEQVYYRYPTPGAANGHAEKTAEAIGFFQPDGVYISEVCAIHDRGSKEKDWIELHNGSASAVSLDGWYLSDSLKDPYKFRISSLSIDADGYAVIETTSSATNRKDGDAGFGIDPSGETLYLADASGVIRDAFHTGVQRNGLSSGRIEGDNHTRRVFFTKKTKGQPNSDTHYAGYAPQPVFSETGLYQTSAFSLRLSCSDPNAVIRYTTNGSEPTEKSKEYTEPIQISKNTVVRAIAVKDGMLKSECVTYNYLFEEPHQVPVVCMSLAPDDFETVYKVKKHRDIQGTERKAQFNYYEADGKIGASFPADVRCKGQGTLTYSQKSFSIHLRGQYGMGKLEYPLFPDYPITSFGALVLRDGGQDIGRSRFCDSFVSRASIGMNIEAADSRATALYVNGKYYGLYELGEDLNADYLETHYGADPELVDLVRYNGDVATQGSSDDWKKLRDSAYKLDLSSDEAYSKYLEKVDEDYFIDYIIARTYFSDTDMINQKYWRVRGSIRWRPLLFDLDYTMRDVKRTDVLDKYFSFNVVTSPHGYQSKFYVFAAFKSNKGFCRKFVERYVEILYTQYDTERLLNLLDQMVAEYEPEMPRQIKRWKEPSSMDKWRKSVEEDRSFIKGRRDVMIAKLKKVFKVSDSEMDALIAKYSKP